MGIRLCAFADEASPNLSGQIAALARNNISLIEIRNMEGKNVKDLTLEEAEIYAKELKKNGIAVWAIGSPLGKVDINVDFSAYLKTAEHIFRLAKVFGTKRIRIFSFFLNEYDKYENLVMERLKMLIQEAKKFGLELYHENEKEIYGDRVERVLKLHSKLPDLKFVFDPANYLQCQEDIDNAIASVHAFTDYFHIKDVIKATGEIVPAGFGDGQIERIVSLVKADKVFTIEPHLVVFSGYSEIDSQKMVNKFIFKDNEEAFDAAVFAFKQILKKCGYIEQNKGWVKKDG